MQWNKQKLQKLVNEYNTKYFNNEIKQPLVVKLDRSLYLDDKEWGNATFKNKGVHVIRLNVKLLNADYDLIEGTLVHEMVHCLQDEIDNTWEETYDDDGGHNKFFNDKCDELNKKFNFKYPLQRYVTAEELQALNDTVNGMYYVYGYEYLNDFNPKCPVGFFIKYLYDIEINMLKRRGFKIKYFDVVKRKKTGEVIDLPSDETIKYTWLKDIDPLNKEQCISDQAVVAGMHGYVHMGYFFNFEDGKPLVESTDINNALQLLESVGYIIQ